MKTVYNMVFFGMGMGAVLLYNKYGSKALKKMESSVKKSAQNLDKKVNQMM